MIVLRANNKIDRAGATDDFRAFGLRDTTGHRNHHMAAIACGGLLDLAEPADLRIDLLHGLFADVTRIQDDEIGLIGIGGFRESCRRQRVRHTMGIVDVHLTAKGFDVNFAGSAHAISVRSACNLACRGGTCPARTIYLILQRF